MAGWRADAGRRLVRNGRAPDHMVMCHGKCSPHMVCYRCSVEGVDSSITTRLLRCAWRVSYGGHSRFLDCVYESPVRGRSSNREHVAIQQQAANKGSRKQPRQLGGRRRRPALASERRAEQSASVSTGEMRVRMDCGLTRRAA
jgi:hypothetical protein